MCVVYHAIAKCECLVRVIKYSIHWFDSLLWLLTSIHWFDSLLRLMVHWGVWNSKRQINVVACWTRWKSPHAKRKEFRSFPVASAASWVASPSPVCSVVTFWNVFRKSRLPLSLPLPFAFASACACALPLSHKTFILNFFLIFSKFCPNLLNSRFQPFLHYEHLQLDMFLSAKSSSLTYRKRALWISKVVLLPNFRFRLKQRYCFSWYTSLVPSK